jgi:plastocyanin
MLLGVCPRLIMRVPKMVVPIVGLVLGGCGSNGVKAASSTPKTTSVPSSIAAANRIPRATIRVAMKNIAFHPEKINARVGQTVTWTDRDADTPHNVTYAFGPRFSSSPTLTTGESWTLKLTKPGTIRYLCTIHPGMDGSIVVRRH